MNGLARGGPDPFDVSKGGKEPTKPEPKFSLTRPKPSLPALTKPHPKPTLNQPQANL